MRCSSFAGFHGRSTFTTAFAACRFSPTLPLSVERKISARRRQLAYQLQHSLPLGEYNDLTVRFAEQIGQNTLKLFELGADAAARIENRRRIADHAHAGEQHLEAVELLRRERPPLGLGEQRGGLPAVVRVTQRLLFDHRHKIIFHRAARQLSFDVALAAAKHQRLQPAPEFGEILVVDRPSTLVELIEVAVEAKQRPDQFGIKVLDDRIELIDAVFHWRTAQHEGVRRAQRLHLAGCLDLPVLDALGFVENDHVGTQDLVNIRRIAEHLLVVHDVEEGRLAVGGKPRRTRPEHRAGRAGGEAGDLLLPFRLKRSWANNQHSAYMLSAGQQLAGRNRLDGLSEAHFVGQQCPLAECKMQHAFTLIWKKREAQQIESRGAVSDLGEKGDARLFARALPALPVEPGRKVT